MAPRSTVPGKKGKGKAKKGKKKGAAGDYDAVLANAIDMLDFAIDGGGGGGGGGVRLPTTSGHFDPPPPSPHGMLRLPLTIK